MAINKKGKEQLKKSGAKLKAARQSRGLTAFQLAEKVGCSVQQIYHCESGHSWFYWPMYIKACAVLNLPVPPLS